MTITTLVALLVAIPLLLKKLRPIVQRVRSNTPRQKALEVLYDTEDLIE